MQKQKPKKQKENLSEEIDKLKKRLDKQEWMNLYLLFKD